MNKNPFHYLLPVGPENFVGRWQSVRKISTDLLSINGDSYAIIAGRRFGKSSFLNAIAFQLLQKEAIEKGDYVALPILFDFKSAADTIESVEAVYAHFLQEIYQQLDDYLSHQLVDNSSAHPKQITKLFSADLTKTNMISFDNFKMAIKHIFGQLNCSTQYVRLVLLLDEIDDTLERSWTQALFSQLRSLIYSSDIKNQVRLVITGSHRFLYQVSIRGSPLWNVLKLQYLEPFDEIGYNELTSRAKGLPEEAAREIWLQSGGHPFLAQYLLHYSWELGILEATKGSVDELSSKFLSEQISDIEGWARSIDVEGLEAYRILSSCEDWIDEKRILQEVDNPSLRVKRGLTALCYNGFVLHDRRWEKYRRIGNIFKSWYDNYGDAFTVSLADHKSINISKKPVVDGGKMKGLTWLHLSDWHQKGKEFDRTVVRDALIKDIENRATIDANLANINFIVFSGDVAFGGKSEEYQAAKEQFFQPLLDACELNPNQLFIVPGNHDLDRDEFKLLPRDLTKPLASEKDVQKWLTDSRGRSRLLEPFQAFTSFVREYSDQEHPDYANVRRMKIDDKEIAILGFNSALICGRNKAKIGDKGFVIVGEPQIHDILEEISDADLKIAVLHHPFDWLAEFDCNRIEARLRHGCDFILRGHQHKPMIEIVSGTSGDCVIIPAGACYYRRIAENPLYTNSYNYVHLDFDTGKGVVFLRRWSDPRTEWVEDNDSCSGGKFEFQLPKLKTENSNSVTNSHVIVSDSASDQHNKMVTQPEGLPLSREPEIEPETGASRVIFDQHGQTVRAQTNIEGNVLGPVFSGQFRGSVAPARDVVDLRGSKGSIYKPRDPVKQHFGDKINISGDGNVIGSHSRATVIKEASTKRKEPSELATEKDTDQNIQRLNLRMDVAVPDSVQVDRAFDVAVSIRMISSPILFIDDLTHTKSGPVVIYRPKSGSSIRLQVQISAPDCRIDDSNRQSLIYIIGEDSDTIYLQLTPEKQGEISIIVRLFQEDERLGNARVHTFASNEAIGQVKVVTSSMPITGAPGVDFLLVTPLPEERDAVLNKLTGYKKLPPMEDDIHTYYKAEVNATFPDGNTGLYRVVVLPLIGIGQTQAATATTTAIDRWRPRYIVVIGIAGGIAAKGIQIGDILIADQIANYELQKVTPEGPEIRWDVHQVDQRLLSACNNFIDESWKELLQVERPGQGEPGRVNGPIASGDKVVAFGEYLKKPQEAWPKLIGVEMEAAGAAKAAFQSSAGSGFFMVRCVSDLADENKELSDVRKWRYYACDVAASFAIALLRSGPVPIR